MKLQQAVEKNLGKRKRKKLVLRTAAELLSQMRHWFVGEERVSSVNPIWRVGRPRLLLAPRDMTGEFSPPPLNAVDTDLSWRDGEVEVGFTNSGKSGASSEFVWGRSGADTPPAPRRRSHVGGYFYQSIFHLCAGFATQTHWQATVSRQ